MSYRQAIAWSFAGAVAGVFGGLGYLDTGDRCDGVLQSVAACRFTHAWLPFACMIILGMLVGLALGAILLRTTLNRDQIQRLVRGGEALGASAGRHGREWMAAVPLGFAGEQGPAPEGDAAVGRPIRLGERGRPVPRPRRAG